MAKEREENLLCLIEVMSNEVFLIGQTCHDARWIGRYKLRKLAREEGSELEELIEPDVICEYDQMLEQTVRRIENIIRLAGERVRELAAARVREGD